MDSCPCRFCAGTQSVRDSYHGRLRWNACLLVVFTLGERIRNRLLKRVNSEDKRKKFINRIWDRYGVAGFGLLAPLLIGAPLGTALGIAMGIQGNRLFFWMSLGIIICAIGLTIAIEFGLMGFESLMRSELL